MDKVFENEYTMETKYFEEYVYNVLCKKLIIGGTIVFFLGLIPIIITNRNTIYECLFWFCIIAFPTIMTPGITAKNLEAAEKRLNNGKIEKTVVKFLDNIIMDEGKVHLEFEYNQITKIVQTKNFIVLKTSEETGILVFKNGFVKGNENDFMKFIEEKININK